MPLTPRAKWLMTAAVTLLMLLLLLAIAEGAVRVRQWIKYGHAGTLDQYFAIDPMLNLKVPVAGARTKTTRINSLGFCGPEIPAVKPAGYLRIAFLGASTTYCAEASSNEATWPHLVTEALRNTYPNIDYVNAAVPGYGLRAMHRILSGRVAQLRPDVIIIYEAANELSSETRELAIRQGIYRKAESGNSFTEYSLLWFLLEKNLRIVRLKQEAAKEQARLEFEPADLGQSLHKQLSELIEEARRVAPVVAVPTFSHRIRAEQAAEQQLQAAASALYYMPYMPPELLIKSFARYNEIIREVARAAGAVLIEGEMEIPADDTHFNDTVHFKDAGSRVMAARVAKGLLGSPEFQALVKRPAVGA